MQTIASLGAFNLTLKTHELFYCTGSTRVQLAKRQEEKQENLRALKIF